MDHPLRTISYIADIGNIVVLMARRRQPRPDSQENLEASDGGHESKRQYKMICHVFESEDVSPTAKSRGAFARQKGRRLSNHSIIHIMITSSPVLSSRPS